MSRRARAVFWSALPEGLSEPERRARFLARYFGDEVSPEARAALAPVPPPRRRRRP